MDFLVLRCPGMSQEELMQNLEHTVSRWRMRPWQQGRPGAYLLECEDAESILDRLHAMHLLGGRVKAEDVAAYADMAAAHAIAFEQVTAAWSPRITATDRTLEIQVQETLGVLFEHPLGARKEDHEAYERLYLDIFKAAFATATALRSHPAGDTTEETGQSAETPEADREVIITTFSRVAVSARRAYRELGQLSERFAGLRGFQLYLAMREQLEAVQHDAHAAVDYVRHATDENWRKGPAVLAEG